MTVSVALEPRQNKTGPTKSLVLDALLIGIHNTLPSIANQSQSDCEGIEQPPWYHAKSNGDKFSDQQGFTRLTEDQMFDTMEDRLSKFLKFKEWKQKLPSVAECLKKYQADKELAIRLLGDNSDANVEREMDRNPTKKCCDLTDDSKQFDLSLVDCLLLFKRTTLVDLYARFECKVENGLMPTQIFYLKVDHETIPLLVDMKDVIKEWIISEYIDHRHDDDYIGKQECIDLCLIREKRLLHRYYSDFISKRAEYMDTRGWFDSEPGFRFIDRYELDDEHKELCQVWEDAKQPNKDPCLKSPAVHRLIMLLTKRMTEIINGPKRERQGEITQSEIESIVDSSETESHTWFSIKSTRRDTEWWKSALRRIKESNEKSNPLCD